MFRWWKMPGLRPERAPRCTLNDEYLSRIRGHSGRRMHNPQLMHVLAFRGVGVLVATASPSSSATASTLQFSARQHFSTTIVTLSPHFTFFPLAPQKCCRPAAVRCRCGCPPLPAAPHAPRAASTAPQPAEALQAAAAAAAARRRHQPLLLQPLLLLLLPLLRLRLLRPP